MLALLNACITIGGQLNQPIQSIYTKIFTYRRGAGLLPQLMLAMCVHTLIKQQHWSTIIK